MFSIIRIHEGEIKAEEKQDYLLYYKYNSK
jgi:hypothetical protein